MFGINADAWLTVHRQEHATLVAMAAVPRNRVVRRKRPIVLATPAPAPTPVCC
jgi:hypothetical protein